MKLAVGVLDREQLSRWTATLGRARLHNLAAVLAYGLILGVCYATYHSRLWYFEGLTWRPPSFWGLVLTLVALSGCALVMPTRYARVSDVIVWLTFVMTVIPGALVAQLSDHLTRSQANWLCLALAAGIALLRCVVAPPPVLRPRRLDTHRWFWVVVLLAVVGVYVWMFSVVRVHLAFLSFTDVYGVRAQFKEGFVATPGLPYVFPLTYAVVNPLLVGVGLMRKRPLFVVIGTIGQVLVYLASGNKMAVLSIPFIALLVLITRPAKPWPTWRLPLVFGASVVMGWVMDLVTGSKMWSAVLSIRLIFLPAVLTTAYVVYFSQHEYVGFSTVLPWVEPRYVENPYVLVGEYLLGTQGTNANVNFFGDGFMNWGYPGMFIEVIFAGVLLRAADEATWGLSLPVACSVFAVPAISLQNGSSFTALLTFGFALAIVVAWLVPVDAQGSVRDGRRFGILGLGSIVSGRGRGSREYRAAARTKWRRR